MNRREYLERIGIMKDVRADCESLRLIQIDHMLSVPFENLDIVNSHPFELKLESIYKKIVVNRRVYKPIKMGEMKRMALSRLDYHCSSGELW